MIRGFQYCPRCGAPIERGIPSGDDRERDICTRDGEIFYHNPLVVVGTVTEWQGRILMCRRAIEPRAGFWTLPAGFLELGETASDAGRRETREEACAKIEMGPLFSFINVPDIGQIHMFYRATLADGQHMPGPESVETALLQENDIPWSQLAFPTIAVTLKRYLGDRRNGEYGTHHLALARGDWQRMGLARAPDKPAVGI
ncbi:MAG: NUDIX hydrolase [Salinisphaera sp.]|nr:NUDIX hydrolase [Salinisphaera sp.]